MNNRIRTYEDLLKEEQQLEELLKTQKEILALDVKQIKSELQPAVMAINFIAKLTYREKNNVLLTEGVNSIIDLVVKKFILRKAGWLTRLTVPYFLKNYASNFVAEHKDQIIDKLFPWFTHKATNGKAESREIYSTEN